MNSRESKVAHSSMLSCDYVALTRNTDVTVSSNEGTVAACICEATDTIVEQQGIVRAADMPEI